MLDTSTDKKTARLLQRAVRENPRLPSGEISVQVREGTATLRGTVASLQEKRSAFELVRSTEGIRRVDNRLHVQPRTLRSDEEIGEDIAEALAEAQVDRRNLVIAIARGRVRLSGTPLNEEDLRSLEEIAARTPGVVEVVSELRDSSTSHAVERSLAA